MANRKQGDRDDWHDLEHSGDPVLCHHIRMGTLHWQKRPGKIEFFCFKKMGHSLPLFHLFSVFPNINTIFAQQINVTNDLSSMRKLGFEFKSPPLTTRPLLPP